MAFCDECGTALTPDMRFCELSGLPRKIAAHQWQYPAECECTGFQTVGGDGALSSHSRHQTRACKHRQRREKGS